jgi:diguanylate cyclase
MTSDIQKPGHTLDFRSKSTLALAVIALIILTPFTINNFIQGRELLGAGSLAIVAILAANAWRTSRGHYYPSLILFSLVPAVLFFLVLSIRNQGMIGIFWCYPAVLAFYCMLPERKAWLANAALLAVALPQAWLVIEPHLGTRVAATLVAVSTFSALFVRVITTQQQSLEALAVTDPLTGLSNRVLLSSTLDEAIEQNSRSGAQMTLVSLDLDHFKAINDSLGHDAGDRVLRGVADILKRRMRRADKVFRLGGEEFLALLYGTDAENGRRVAEELRATIASLALFPGHPTTVSIGVATLERGEDAMAWMKRSDENLYRAKSGGRNQVVG